MPALLTRQQQPKSFIPTLKPSSSRLRPGLQNALAIRKKPCYKSQGMKQLMAGGGVALIGITLIPLLSGLFG